MDEVFKDFTYKIEGFGDQVLVFPSGCVRVVCVWFGIFGSAGQAL
jgi:hypothetical protein